jgi:hypothetical protein
MRTICALALVLGTVAVAPAAEPVAPPREVTITWDADSLDGPAPDAVKKKFEVFTRADAVKKLAVGQDNGGVYAANNVMVVWKRTDAATVLFLVADDTAERMLLGTCATRLEDLGMVALGAHRYALRTRPVKKD